ATRYRDQRGTHPVDNQASSGRESLASVGGPLGRDARPSTVLRCEDQELRYRVALGAPSPPQSSPRVPAASVDRPPWPRPESVEDLRVSWKRPLAESSLASSYPPPPRLREQRRSDHEPAHHRLPHSTHPRP